MSKKTEEKLEIKEIKTYQTSDGSVFDTKDAALTHEHFLKDCNDNPLIASKIKELESKILQLEAENASLSARITALEAQKSVTSFPWSKPNPDIYPQPWGPYQQPFNPTAPTPKLPAQPGDIVYDAVEISKMSDEELIKKGYQVSYVGDKRAVCPPITQFDFDKVKGNNVTTPPEYFGNPCDNQEYNTGHTGLVYGEMEKRRMEWQRKNKK